ncbi:hypothetical protein ACQ4M3_09555 [Leptolyngbya sp. AN03gr2]|uniref:hypothetical protein n=1 Tax=Leptolyngbya sp. AN03gr2 TaxID=3423364 RepID=UPI003D31AD09
MQSHPVPPQDHVYERPRYTAPPVLPERPVYQLPPAQPGWVPPMRTHPASYAEVAPYIETSHVSVPPTPAPNPAPCVRPEPAQSVTVIPPDAPRIPQEPVDSTLALVPRSSDSDTPVKKKNRLDGDTILTMLALGLLLGCGGLFVLRINPFARFTSSSPPSKTQPSAKPNKPTNPPNSVQNQMMNFINQGRRK